MQPIYYRMVIADIQAIWNHIMNISVADLKKNYANLNVEFDLWKGESDAQAYIPDMMEQPEKRRICPR